MPKGGTLDYSIWVFFCLCAILDSRLVPQVVQIGIKAATMMPKGAQRSPNELKLVANGWQKDRKNSSMGGFLGKYIAAILSTCEFENVRAIPPCVF